MQQKPRIELL
uniref:Uncharacterized protein n=1 Tax=Arundo donax TaxID=35708 RepID=A0A0A9BRR0_ARUDO